MTPLDIVRKYHNSGKQDSKTGTMDEIRFIAGLGFWSGAKGRDAITRRKRLLESYLDIPRDWDRLGINGDICLDYARKCLEDPRVVPDMAPVRYALRYCPAGEAP